MADVSNEDLFECATLVYRRWSEEYDLLKQVKSEKNDRSPDWELMHAERLKNHTAAEQKWRELRDRLSSKLPRL